MADGTRVVTKRRRAARARLNLATNPSGGYRALFVLECAMAVALVGTAVGLTVVLVSSEGPPGELLARERELDSEQSSLRDLAASASAKTQGARPAEVIERTAFLNELLIRKGVSWTRTFLDLEEVLPPNVRVLTIEPEVARGDTIRLDMTLSAKAPEDFIGFLKTLEGSALFGSPTLRGSAPPSDTDPTFRYQLAVEYDQQL